MAPAAERRPLLFVNQHYHPDVAATGQLLTDLAEHLVDGGRAVEVLCARGAYTSGQLDVAAAETHNGVSIRRYWVPGAGRRRHLGRILDYLVFIVQVAGRLLFGPRPAAVVVLTTPPMLPALAALVKRVRRVSYAVWSMDLHPEAEVAAGLVRPDGAVARALTAIADDAYRGADLVVVLGSCMRRLVLGKGVSAERIALVPPWTSLEEVRPVARSENPLASELSLGPDDFLVMYSGNAGLAHSFDVFLEAARRLEEDGDVRFLFVGEGPRRSEIESFASEHGLTRLMVRDYFPRDRLSDALSLADVHLVSLRSEFEGIAVPAKLYGIMAAGRPVLFLGPESCETGRTILDTGCGAVVDPGSGGNPGDRAVEILLSWRDSPSLRTECGALGRAAFLDRFERARGCATFAAELSARWRL